MSITVPIFSTPLDPPNQTVVGSARAIGAATLQVATNTGSYFGSPSTSAPVRITVVRTTTDDARTHFLVTNVSGDTLTVAVSDGYSDLAVNAGDSVGVWVSAATITELQTPIRACVSAINSGSSGGQGSQGYQGSTGSQGGQGSQGASGSQGSQGNSGSTGSQGPQGYQGSSGSQGSQGNSGSTGSQGPQGYQGSSGSQGSQGNSGSTGSQGPQGYQGSSGSQGSQGYQGYQGNQGTYSTSTVNQFTSQQLVTPAALTAGSTVSWNINTQSNATLTATSNFTLANPTNLLAGGSGMLTITQDSTGSRVITWGSAYRFPGGTKVVLSTAASAVDEIAWYSPDGSHVDMSGNKGFA